MKTVLHVQQNPPGKKERYKEENMQIENRTERQIRVNKQGYVHQLCCQRK